LIALPEHLARVEVDEICGLGVDRQLRLPVRGQPVVRKVEMVE
jgi:hypothetical protein